MTFFGHPIWTPFGLFRPRIHTRFRRLRCINAVTGKQAVRVKGLGVAL